MNPERRTGKRRGRSLFILSLLILTALEGAVLAYLYGRQFDARMELLLEGQRNMARLESRMLAEGIDTLEGPLSADSAFLRYLVHGDGKVLRLYLPDSVDSDDFSGIGIPDGFERLPPTVLEGQAAYSRGDELFTEGGHWLITPAHPSVSLQGEGSSPFFLVYHSPKSALRRIRLNILISLVPVFLMMLCLSILFSLFISGSARRFRDYQERLDHHGGSDELTGCPTGRAGLRMLEQLLSLSRRHNSLLTAACMDIGGMARVNRLHGRQEGDRYMKTMVELLREELRQTDLLIRLREDKFLLVLPDCKGGDAEGIRERLLKKEQRINREAVYPYPLGMHWEKLVISPENQIRAVDVVRQIEGMLIRDKAREARE